MGYESEFTPKLLPEPSQSLIVESVLKKTEEELFQNPTKLEMVHDLVLRHSFATYPFEWFTHGEDEVAKAYQDYVGSMLGEDTVSKGELHDLLAKIDLLFEYRGM